MNEKNLIRHTFVRQIDENDCGIACLATIMNLSGHASRVPLLRNDVYIPNDGLSLLQLRNLAAREGFNAACVELEIKFLRENATPCILLMTNAQGNGHFQVCYRAERTRTGHRYLMADPAIGLHYLEEPRLKELWPTRAALYFHDLHIRKPANSRRFSVSLLTLRIYPKMFLIAIPFLNTCILLFGATTSWILQKLIDGSIIQKPEKLLLIMLSLLLTINLFKNGAAYVKELLLLRLSILVQQKLNALFTADIATATSVRKLSMSENSIKFIMAEIEKINKAITVLVATLMSDGIIVVFLLSVITCFDSVSALINLLFFGIACAVTIAQLPYWFEDRTQIGKTYSEAAALLAACVGRQPIVVPNTAADMDTYKAKYADYLGHAKTFACKTAKTGLWIDGLGTINVMLVFTLQAVHYFDQQIAFAAMLLVIIMSYMNTALLPKICDAIFTVSQGSASLRQYSYNIAAKI